MGAAKNGPLAFLKRSHCNIVSSLELRNWAAPFACELLVSFLHWKAHGHSALVAVQWNCVKPIHASDYLKCQHTVVLLIHVQSKIFIMNYVRSLLVPIKWPNCEQHKMNCSVLWAKWIGNWSTICKTYPIQGSLSLSLNCKPMLSNCMTEMKHL